MCAVRMKQCWQFFIPLFNSDVDNVLVKIAPDLNQSVFQFINALDVCIVNTFLDGRPYLVVNWVQAWAAWRSNNPAELGLACLYTVV